MHCIKLSGYNMGIKFHEDPLAVEQNNYLTKIVNVCVVYDLNVWPRNRTNNLKFKNSLFLATNIVINFDKEKYGYSCYGIKFDSTGSWSFNSYSARIFLR